MATLARWDLTSLTCPGDPGNHEFDRGGTGNGHGLLAESCEDRFDQWLGATTALAAGIAQHARPTGGRQARGAAVTDQQVEWEFVGQDSAGEDPFEDGVDLGEQGPDPVEGPGGLVGEVLVETGKNFERREGLGVTVDLPKCVGHGAGRVGDDERVAGIGLGPAGIQVGSLAQSEAGQVGHGASAVSGDRDGKRADGVGLVDNHEHTPVLLEAGEQIA